MWLESVETKARLFIHSIPNLFIHGHIRLPSHPSIYCTHPNIYYLKSQTTILFQRNVLMTSFGEAIRYAVPPVLSQTKQTCLKNLFTHWVTHDITTRSCHGKKRYSNYTGVTSGHWRRAWSSMSCLRLVRRWASIQSSWWKKSMWIYEKTSGGRLFKSVLCLRDPKCSSCAHGPLRLKLKGCLFPAIKSNRQAGWHHRSTRGWPAACLWAATLWDTHAHVPNSAHYQF